MQSLSDLTFGLLLLFVLSKFGEKAVWIRHELLRGAILQLTALVEHEDAIAVDDCVQSVRDGQDCRTTEFFTDQLLDRLLGDYVDIGGGFVKHNDLVVPQDSPDDANQLALTNAEVLSLLLDLEVEALAIVLILYLLFRVRFLFFLAVFLLPVFGVV